MTEIIAPAETMKTAMDRHRETCPNGCGYCSEIAPITAKQVAQAAGIAPRTKQFTLRDEYGDPRCDADGFRFEGCRTEHVLLAIAFANNVDGSVDIAARAIYKSFTTGRMRIDLVRHFREDLTPYQICAAVAKVVNEYGTYNLHTRSVGAVADYWLNEHADLF